MVAILGQTQTTNCFYCFVWKNIFMALHWLIYSAHRFKHWLSKGPARTCLPASITWELARNADSQAPPSPTESEALQVGSSKLGLNALPGDSAAHKSLRTFGLKLLWVCEVRSLIGGYLLSCQPGARDPFWAQRINSSDSLAEWSL